MSQATRTRATHWKRMTQRIHVPASLSAVIARWKKYKKPRFLYNHYKLYMETFGYNDFMIICYLF